MTRPRAADDFPVIRARLEELRRERGETTPATMIVRRAGRDPMRSASVRCRAGRRGCRRPCAG